MSDQQRRQPGERIAFSRREPSRDEVVLAVEGPLYHEFADEFQGQLDALVAGGWAIVTLDFRKVKVIASLITGKILILKMRLQEHRREVRIRGCDPGLYAQFKAVRFDRMLDIQQ
jgi:anti-anti-sigma regulatory factor